MWIRKKTLEKTVAWAKEQHDTAEARLETIARAGLEAAKLLQEQDVLLARILALESLQSLSYKRDDGETEPDFRTRLENDIEAIRATPGLKAVLFLLNEEEEREYASWLAEADPATAELKRQRAMASRQMRQLIVQASNKRTIEQAAKARRVQQTKDEQQRYQDLVSVSQKAT